MRIEFVEIRNFRKLKAVRIDINEKTTLCVGANNSGKTSAMIALSTFLMHPSRFTTNDFTLSDWNAINALGTGWLSSPPDWGGTHRPPAAWEEFLPSLDVWLHVETHELHFVRDLIPTLDWAGGRLGVRLRFEPKDIQELSKDFLAAMKAAAVTVERGRAEGGTGPRVTLWPGSLRSFLDKKLHRYFTLQYYLLDPSRAAKPTHGIAEPQTLPVGSEPLERNPLDGLVRMDEISAQRGLGEATGVKSEEGDVRSARGQRRLSGQLRAYYAEHLDPTEHPEPADLGALEAIEQAQSAYNARLRTGFSDALKELEQLNYPGVTDPKLTIATQLRPSDGLNHSAAVQYDVCQYGQGATTSSMTLPEDYNGLGYQNLISMVFKLMSFRDAWMQVGKAAKAARSERGERSVPRIHLVLVEEPEAYLHAQVQQVFVKKAYNVLRNHKDLGDNPGLVSQMVVSTHSSHIAHECEFACLRYFRRQPAPTPSDAPTAAVINLSEVFGADEATPRFVTRYLRATHCDLFFADAAIFVEGPAERMLLPQFIRRHFDALHRRYVTVLDIGGSHAHRFRPLIEKLGLITLVITDLDSAVGTGRHPKAPPKRGQNQVTRNTTLKTWHPEKPALDELLDLRAAEKTRVYADMPRFSIRVAYQTPMAVTLGAADPVETLANTFEDALILENLQFFRDIRPEEEQEQEATKDIIAAVQAAADPASLSAALFPIIDKLNKAAFALDLLWTEKSESLIVPRYIREGLEWLESQLSRSEETPLPSGPEAVTTEVAA